MRILALLPILLLACTPKPTTIGGPGTTPVSSSAAYGPAPMQVAQTAAQAPIDGIPMVSMPSGLKYWVLREGTGATPSQGDTVAVHYTGWLADGTKFDSSFDRGTPLQFKVGGGQVIKGWDEGVATMKVGEKRRLQVPPGLGYGERGAGGMIPGGATLVFEVELMGIVGKG
ncbi:MAG: FKBP-type peptidyl-prolyl cis-trans isomerase [Pseudomonadota bacterium]|nr:FKBP-type peptidyl-prolyl cis-trans isomerase [Pseudomonadota bacterium]